MLLVASIKEHFLVPPHYLLSEEQAAQILQEIGVEKKQLPVIHKNDSAIKEFKPRKGDVIKIVRNSQTAGKTIYYRRVL